MITSSRQQEVSRLTVFRLRQEMQIGLSRKARSSCNGGLVSGRKSRRTKLIPNRSFKIVFKRGKSLSDTFTPRTFRGLLWRLSFFFFVKCHPQGVDMHVPVVGKYSLLRHNFLVLFYVALKTPASAAESRLFAVTKKCVKFSPSLRRLPQERETLSNQATS